MKVLIPFAAALAVALSPAQAAERYAGIAAGAWLPDTGGGNIKTELDTGIAGELRAGWRFEDRFALEGAIGGLSAESELPPADVTETTLHSVAAWYVLLGARGFLPIGDGTWRVGASAGLGYYSADLQAKEPQPPPNEVDATETDTGYHIGAGVHWAVTEKAVLVLEYRQVSASPGDVDIDGAAALLGAEYHY